MEGICCEALYLSHSHRTLENNKMKRITQLVKLTPLALALMPAAVWADTGSEIAELKARLVQLEQMVKEAAAKPAPVAAPAAQSMAATMGDTKISFKGYVKLDALSSSFSEGEVGRVTGRDFYVPNAIPVFGGAGSGATAGANGKSRNFYDMHAKQTRFIINTDTPTTGGPSLKGHIEIDFLSSAQGNENVSNGYSPELRQAFFTYGNWLAGQSWTTFQDLGALPETVDFVGSSDGSVFGRQPQVRYTRGPWQFSVENSQTVTGTSASATATESNDNGMPDLVARYTHKGDFGHVSLAALGRQIKNKDNVISDTANGYGISLSGKVKTFGKDDVRFMITHGQGIGRYVGLNSANDAVVNAAGNLDTIDITAGYISYRHAWSEKLRSSFQVASFEASNPASASADATQSVRSGLVNLIYNVTPKLEVGVEAMHATREVEGGADGSMDRLQFMAKHSF